MYLESAMYALAQAVILTEMDVCLLLVVSLKSLMLPLMLSDDTTVTHACSYLRVSSVYTAAENTEQNTT